MASRPPLNKAKKLWADGATWVDIGEKAPVLAPRPVSEAEEIDRVVPVISAIRQARPTGLISIDTRHAQVAEAALQAGANMVNDVSGGRDDRLA